MEAPEPNEREVEKTLEGVAPVSQTKHGRRPTWMPGRAVINTYDSGHGKTTSAMRKHQRRRYAARGPDTRCVGKLGSTALSNWLVHASGRQKKNRTSDQAVLACWPLCTSHLSSCVRARTARQAGGTNPPTRRLSCSHHLPWARMQDKESPPPHTNQSANTTQPPEVSLPPPKPNSSSAS